eukprot:jgi/Chlat1/3599/Chrsp234S03583
MGDMALPLFVQRPSHVMGALPGPDMNADPHIQHEEGMAEGRPAEDGLELGGRKKGRKRKVVDENGIPMDDEGGSGKVTRGFVSAWVKTFPWVRLKDGRIFCSVCSKYKKNTKYAKEGGRNMKHSALIEHQTSKVHQDVVAAESVAKTMMVQWERPIEMAEAVTFNCLRVAYYVAKNDLGLIDYPALTELLRACGVKDLPQDMYTDETACSRFVHCISDSMWDRICRELRKSPFVGIMVDESLDATPDDPLMVYAVSLKHGGTLQWQFLCLLQVDDASADGMYTALSALLQRIGLDNAKFIGFGSDGSAAMVRRSYGVAAKLKRLNPFMVATHSGGHSVAMAAANAAAAVPYAKQVDGEISSLYGWFVRSPRRYSKLAFLMDDAGGPILRLQRTPTVRWLPKPDCVSSLRRSLNSLMSLLAADDAALYDRLRSYQFLFAVHFLSDILARLTRLSGTFAAETVDLAVVEHNVNGLMEQLKEEYLSDQPTLGPEGGYLREFLDQVGASGMFYDHAIRYTSNDDLSESMNFVRSFTSAVITNLQERFPQLEVLTATRILTPNLYPPAEHLPSFGRAELEVLLAAFGTDKYVTGETFPAVVDADACRREWPEFKHLLYSAFEDKGLSETIRVLTSTQQYMELYPNMTKLGQLALVLPVSTAWSERGFQKSLVIKDRLKQHCSIRVLDDLLRISLNGPQLEDMDLMEAYALWKSGVAAQRASFREPNLKPLPVSAAGGPTAPTAYSNWSAPSAAEPSYDPTYWAAVAEGPNQPRKRGRPPKNLPPQDPMLPLQRTPARQRQLAAGETPKKRGRPRKDSTAYLQQPMQPGMPL